MTLFLATQTTYQWNGLGFLDWILILPLSLPITHTRFICSSPFTNRYEFVSSVYVHRYYQHTMIYLKTRLCVYRLLVNSVRHDEDRDAHYYVQLHRRSSGSLLRGTRF